ncbi:UNVERIFIED_CONTAM: Pyruvate kinase, cytosolic [Sesamum latifolium]|uniref:Pyruvate kinase n=1 Tax=Sesamum latifolium TaxID=2727402 RepID=A0AAW2TC82_9LAMI
MVSNHLHLEEPIRMSSIIEPSKPNFFPAMTKIVGTLGPKSRSVEAISGCLRAGMSGGPELQVVNKTEHPISLEEDALIVLTPDQDKEATSNLLPINFKGLSKAVKTGDTIFIGQYLFTGNETTSIWLEVNEVKGEDVHCIVKNSATLAGSLYTLHVSQIHIELPTLTDKDKEHRLHFRFIHAARGRHQTWMIHFDEILQEADGIILARGNLGIDLPPEKVFLFQKQAVHKCNMAGKPAVVTRVVDSMTDNLRPTRAEATDVANAVLDGSDAILLGAETLRGLYPVEAISIVGRICAEAEKVYNQDFYFRKAVKCVGQPMSHIESIASSAVRAAIKVKASVIICFTSSGQTARLIAKYRPTMPVLSVVIPRLKTDQLHWTFTGAFEVYCRVSRMEDQKLNIVVICPSSNDLARQSLIVRGLFPMLADARHPVETTNATNESILKVALDHGQASGIVKPHDRVVVCQKVGDASVVKIIELEN